MSNLTLVGGEMHDLKLWLSLRYRYIIVTLSLLYRYVA